MGTALYRSYRSKSFDEVIGQEHITQTLKNSIKSGTHAHAYLFTGPRGVGKTSVARILAYSLNNAPYPPESPEVDIIEIDAASNRRIDEIRELRERISIAPTSLKHKVYIIDEVHMLTREAFNALLKTLEEPPDHAVFILATTDINKVPDTIVSRCLRFHFKPLTVDDIVLHLDKIAQQEKIIIDNESLTILAEASDGSFRDAIAMLDQLRGLDKQISSDQVKNVLGLGSEELVDSILKAIKNGNLKNIAQLLSKAERDGVRTQALSSQISKSIKENLLDNEASVTPIVAVELLDSLNAVAKQDDKTALELALFKTTARNISDMSTKELNNAEEPFAEVELRPPVNMPPPLESNNTEAAVALPGNDELWESILAELKMNNRNLYGIARMAVIETTATAIVLAFRFPFHYKQINLGKNKRALEDTIRKISPEIKVIEIKLADSGPSSNHQSEDITNITNIFGSSEVLES